jgi:hypothetical protein
MKKLTRSQLQYRLQRAEADFRWARSLKELKAAERKALALRRKLEQFAA